jgi:4-amino-4-deoxy-L-arabinose transferase-like glycosyltransferase
MPTTANQRTRGQLPTAERVVVFAALLLMALLAIGSYRQESLTFDEVTHIPSGLAYWQQHDTRLNIEHPPLLKMIAAFPLLFTDIRADYTDPSWCESGWTDCQWTFGNKFFRDWNSGVQRIVFLARLPMLFLALLLGWIIYRMARALAGSRGALLSLTVFVTSPLYLGYGPLVITDIGLCLFVILSAWTFADLWTTPNLRNAAAFALSTAAALLSKFSALLIGPALVLFCIWSLLKRQPEDSQKRQRAQYLIGGVLGAVLVCYLFYWLACYHSTPHSLANARLGALMHFRPPERILALVTGVLSAYPAWERPLQPLWLYLTGIGYLNAGLSRPVYLLGKLHGHGVWYYFPVISFFKLAPGMLGLAATLLVCAFLYRRRKPRENSLLIDELNRARLRALTCTLAAFTIAAMRSRINIGIRHFSVPITIVVILIALPIPLVEILWKQSRRTIAYAIVALLAASCVITAITAYPHYISYYNWFRLGTPKQEIVAESNLDWGQSLLAVDSFVREHGISRIYMDSMSPLSPNVYVPRATEWYCDDFSSPSPEWVAVSADFVRRSPPTCIGLMRYQHWELADATMYIFRITDESYAADIQRWRSQHPKESVSPARVH